MKLWILSDLHLETVPHPELFAPMPPDFDVLVCVGDVVSGDVEAGFKTLRRLAGRKPVITTLGNHEFWNSYFEQVRTVTPALAKKYQITLLDGQAVTLSKVYFVGVTLWTDFKLGQNADDAAPTGEPILISRNEIEAAITVDDTRALHRADLDKLTALITAAPLNMPLVVVTHHAPHPSTLLPPGADHPKAGIAASDLTDLTDAGRVRLWIHGHLHHSADITRPGGTRLLCNPAGRQFENSRFEEDKVVEIN